MVCCSLERPRFYWWSGLRGNALRSQSCFCFIYFRSIWLWAALNFSPFAVLSAWTIQTSGVQINCSPGKLYLVVKYVHLSILLSYFLVCFFSAVSSTCLCNKLLVQSPSIHPREQGLEGYSVMTPPFLTARLIKHAFIKAFHFLWCKPIHHSQPWVLSTFSFLLKRRWPWRYMVNIFSKCFMIFKWQGCLQQLMKSLTAVNTTQGFTLFWLLKQWFCVWKTFSSKRF